MPALLGSVPLTQRRLYRTQRPEMTETAPTECLAAAGLHHLGAGCPVAVEICGSASEIRVEDTGIPPARIVYDVTAIAQEFGLEFDAAGSLRDHLGYLLTSGS